MGVRCDLNYARTVAGVIQILQLIVGVVVLICIGSADYTVDGIWFVSFTAVGSICTSGILFALTLTHLSEVAWLVCLPWTLIRTLAGLIWCFCYFISGCIAISMAVRYQSLGNHGSAYGTAGCFTWTATLIYSLDIFLFYRRWRDVKSLQRGQHTVNIPPTPFSPPDPLEQRF